MRDRASDPSSGTSGRLESPTTRRHCSTRCRRWMRGGFSRGIQCRQMPRSPCPCRRLAGPKRAEKITSTGSLPDTLPRILASSLDQRRANRGTVCLGAVGSRTTGKKKHHYDEDIYSIPAVVPHRVGLNRQVAVCTFHDPVVGMDLFPASSISFPRSQSWGACPVCTPHPQQSPAGLPTKKVLSTCPPTSATLAFPLARQVPDTEPRDGPQIQIAKRLRREVRHIHPANRIAPFRPPPPLQETVFSCLSRPGTPSQRLCSASGYAGLGWLL
jgi:hypothetical protein